MKLTPLKVDSIKPAGDRQEIPDAVLPGLYLLVQNSGAKSYAIRYRHYGRPRKYTLGRHPALTLQAARNLARTALQAVAEGRDPSIERRKQRESAALQNGLTVEAMFVDFLTLRTRKRNGKPIRESSTAETARLLGLKRDPENPDQWIRTGNGVLSYWKGRTLQDVTRADVHALLDKLAAKTPITANRTLAALRTAFSWRVKRDPETLAKSPCDNIDHPAGESTRDRELSDQELAAIWRAADQTEFPYGPMVKLLMLLGQRRGEVAGMRWSEIDLKDKSWTLPGERTKNGQKHVVPLVPQAMAILNAMPRVAGSDFVFTSFGDVASANFAIRKKLLDALLADSVAPWVLHDLRRAVRTGLGRLGVLPHVAEAVLNHLPPKLVRTYDLNSYDAEKREALSKWARHLNKITRK